MVEKVMIERFRQGLQERQRRSLSSEDGREGGEEISKDSPTAITKSEGSRRRLAGRDEKNCWLTSSTRAILNWVSRKSGRVQLRPESKKRKKKIY